MIIELNGLSGIGKTTLAHEIGDLLKKEGYTIAYSYPLNERRITRRIKYLFDGSLIVWTLGFLFALTSVYPRDSKRIKYVKNIVSYYRMYRAFQKEGSKFVLIVDQGIMQAVSSIVHMDAINGTGPLKLLFTYLSKRHIRFVSIDCENDHMLSFRRIRERNAATGRWENYDDVLLQTGLSQQTRAFVIIRECAQRALNIKRFSVDTRLPAYINAEKVFDHISSCGGKTGACEPS